MYQRFFGLRERPFELTSNPKYLFFSAQHREALANLEYGLSSAKAITVVVGEAGTGKTTLLRAALESERCRRVKAIVLDNPTLTREEFVEILAARFELGDTAAYIVSRIRTAGGNTTKLFTREAVTLIHEFSRGIPRVINVMCDNALISGFALKRQPVDRDIVAEVCRDFDLTKAEAPQLMLARSRSRE